MNNCSRCAYYEHLIRVDLHWRAQHMHALMMHRLYGSCGNR